jgi:DNA-binding PadR family transcriptional regulator
MGRRPGLVTLAILNAIREGHRYGADIMDVTELGGGSVYKTLSRLERRGWIEGRWEDPKVAEAERRPRRRFYALTAEGERGAADGRREVERLTGIVRARA